MKRIIGKRDRAWAKFKHKQRQKDWLKYKALRNETVGTQRILKRGFELGLANRAKECPKRYYAYVQSQKSLRNGIDTIKIADNIYINSEYEKAEAFLNYFKSVHHLDIGTATHDTENLENIEVIADLTVSIGHVKQVLKELKPYKSPGPDRIYPVMVKILSDTISPAICELFQASLSQALVPHEWKNATVVALHKGGKTDDIKNYRPVSLTCILCKCLEKIIRLHICDHLTKYKLLQECQHGFMKGKSCLTNLLSYLDEVSHRLNEGKKIEVCYLDFSKAFDSVNHRLLLHKLESFGITGNLCNWIKDFLVGRRFRVRIGGTLSNAEVVQSGVPQGSVLGPLLFILFVNDLARRLESPTFLFADDVKLVGSSGRTKLVEDIKIVEEWAWQWDLNLNSSKSHLLSKSDEAMNVCTPRGTMSIATVTKSMDLGVVMTADFKWEKQCLYAAARARKELFRLKGVLSCKKTEVFIPLYKAIVRPHLEYCVQAWSPYLQKDIKCLEKVQRLATKMVEGQKGKSYKERLAHLGLFSLSRRRLRGDLIETFKALKGLNGIKHSVGFDLVTGGNTRGHALKLRKTHANIMVRSNYFSERTVNMWNKLPGEIVDLDSVDAFKRALDNKWTVIFPDIMP
ncbi:MAG: RNA-directed DNA polymerase [Paraclostridium sp.]|uniref:RNA-directed DNA polymerase n=1 Tax=Paraclostridium sp. TaxID=2023273 RepID=UPI003F412B19